MSIWIWTQKYFLLLYFSEGFEIKWVVKRIDQRIVCSKINIIGHIWIHYEVWWCSAGRIWTTGVWTDGHIIKYSSYQIARLHLDLCFIFIPGIYLICKAISKQCPVRWKCMRKDRVTGLVTKSSQFLERSREDPLSHNINKT